MFQDNEIDAMTTGDPFGCPPHGKYEKLISLAKQVPPATTVVVYPCDETLARRYRGGGIGNINWLAGPAAKITAVPSNMGSISLPWFVDAAHRGGRSKGSRVDPQSRATSMRAPAY
jgi:hypothetical protein